MQEINRLAQTDALSLLTTQTAYHVADTYHPHRFHGAAIGMHSPYESFQDDALLRRTIRLHWEYGGSIQEDTLGKLAIVSGTQACSNFRPGFACLLYREYCQPGATVLDTSTGYGGRLVGFMASGIAGRYIGIDPSTATHAGNTRMADELGFAERVALYNLPAEDITHDAVRGRCDFAFTSPPYFCKERYCDEDTQSWKRYHTGEAWRDGFLRPMLALQYAALKPGCYSLVNIEDVRIKTVTYPLVAWTVQCSREVGFVVTDTRKFLLAQRMGQGHEGAERATETVLVLQKPGVTP